MEANQITENSIDSNQSKLDETGVEWILPARTQTTFIRISTAPNTSMEQQQQRGEVDEDGVQMEMAVGTETGTSARTEQLEQGQKLDEHEK